MLTVIRLTVIRLTHHIINVLFEKTSSVIETVYLVYYSIGFSNVINISISSPNVSSSIIFIGGRSAPSELAGLCIIAQSLDFDFEESSYYSLGSNSFRWKPVS